MRDPSSKLQVHSKIWLEIDGKPVFGQGREVLLRLIQKGNSINAAAKEMGTPIPGRQTVAPCGRDRPVGRSG